MKNRTKYCLSAATFLASMTGGLFGANIDEEALKYYEQTEVIPEKWHGWFNNQKQLDKLFSKIKPKVVIELGSFLGLSTSYMGKKLKDEGKIYAIDHWMGSIEHQGRPDVDHLLPSLFEQFLSNMVHQNLQGTVLPLKMTTVEASSLFHSGQADLIYVDASHDEESVYLDLTLYYPLLRKGGYLCGDDWSWASVRKAVERFAKDKRLRVHGDANFWHFNPKP